MSVKIDAGEGVKRGDVFFVDPREVVLNQECRGRTFMPTRLDVVELAISMLDRGQLQPCGVRRIEGNKIEQTYGFTRNEAARLIIDAFEHEGKKYEDKDFKLQVIVRDCNEFEAFKNNIVENRDRNETSSIDDAHNHNTLRTRHGMSNADIARLYRMSEVTVGQYAKLLQLSESDQLLVHAGKMAVSTAISLLQLPKEERTVVVESAKNEDGKVKGGVVKEKVREKAIEASKANTAPIKQKTEDAPVTPPIPPPVPQSAPQKRVSRSVKDLRDYLRERLAFLKAKSFDWTQEQLDTKIQVVESLQAWIDGIVADESLTDSLDQV